MCECVEMNRINDANNKIQNDFICKYIVWLGCGYRPLGSSPIWPTITCLWDSTTPSMRWLSVMRSRQSQLLTEYSTLDNYILRRKELCHFLSFCMCINAVNWTKLDNPNNYVVDLNDILQSIKYIFRYNWKCLA